MCQAIIEIFANIIINILFFATEPVFLFFSLITAIRFIIAKQIHGYRLQSF